MTTVKSLSIAAIIIAAILFIYVLGVTTPSAHATAGFLPAAIATTSNPTVTTTAGTLFATSTCVSRIVTTSASAVMLTFSDYAGQTPTGSFGHLQPASTTVVYDSGQFGCGRVQVYSFATQLITVSESR